MHFLKSTLFWLLVSLLLFLRISPGPEHPIFTEHLQHSPRYVTVLRLVLYCNVREDFGISAFCFDCVGPIQLFGNRLPGSLRALV